MKRVAGSPGQVAAERVPGFSRRPAAVHAGFQPVAGRDHLAENGKSFRTIAESIIPPLEA